MIVSRETRDSLDSFAGLVKKWSPKINLISTSTFDEIWPRHIQDSLQLVNIADNPKNWLDFGSGGGFPGVVVAIVLFHQDDNCKVTLVESDTRKCAFLRTVNNILGLGMTILNDRIEKADRQQADVVSARAVADLDKLLSYTQPHLVPGGRAIFPKGKKWKEELDAARRSWSFDADMIQSQTNDDSVILKITNLERA